MYFSIVFTRGRHTSSDKPVLSHQALDSVIFVYKLTEWRGLSKITHSMQTHTVYCRLRNVKCGWNETCSSTEKNGPVCNTRATTSSHTQTVILKISLWRWTLIGFAWCGSLYHRCTTLLAPGEAAVSQFSAIFVTASSCSNPVSNVRQM